MKVAAEEEKRQAIEQGSIHEGVPAVSVIVDGVEQMHTQAHVMQSQVQHYNW